MKTDEPIISIVVPVYNGEKYISKCIDSLMNQTLFCIEIILVDDGSTDKSLEICQHYESMDSRIITIQKYNSGVSASRNIGIKVAHGFYVMFCDADDWVEETLLEQLIIPAQANNADFVGSGYCEDFYESDTLIKSKKVGVSESMLCNGKSFSNDLNYIFRCGHLLISTPWAKLFKRSVFERNGINFNEDSVYAEDFEMNLRFLCKVSRCVFVAIEKYHYTHIMGSESINKIKKRDIVDEIDFVFQAIRLFNFVYPNKELCEQTNIWLYNAYGIAIKQMMKENNYQQKKRILCHLMDSVGFCEVTEQYRTYNYLRKVFQHKLYSLAFCIIKWKLI